MAPLTVGSHPELDHLLLPSQDPWYTAPPDYEASAPGTVLKIRPVPSGWIIFGNAAAAYHILYRTTGSRYQPTWAVTQVSNSFLHALPIVYCPNYLIA